MQTKPVFLSVVIPSFRRYPYLIDTVNALLSQQYTNYEILIVDQTPGDGLRPTELWLTAAERVRYWHLTRPSVPLALNKGIEEARGEIVLFLDDDVIPSEGLLAGHAACYADPSVGGVQGRVTDQFMRDPTPGPFGCLEPTGHVWGNPATLQPTTPIRATIGCNLSFRREALVRAGGIDPAFLPPFNMWETELCLQLSRMGYRIAFAADGHVEHLLAVTGGVGNRRPTFKRHYGSIFNTFLVALKHPDAVHLRKAFAFRAGGSPTKIGVALLVLAHLLVMNRNKAVPRQAVPHQVR